MIVKDEVAEELIQWHFRIDEELTEIYRFLAPDEDAPGEPIKLLEVNPDFQEMGFVAAFKFPGAGNIPYSTAVAIVTPTEMAQIQAGKMPLPPDWSLDRAHRYQPAERRNGKK